MLMLKVKSGIPATGRHNTDGILREEVHHDYQTAAEPGIQGVAELFRHPV